MMDAAIIMPPVRRPDYDAAAAAKFTAALAALGLEFGSPAELEFAAARTVAAA